ncbi:beta-hydroxylase [Allofrancisella inopinata]|uniref:Aspartyl/asparaginyl beta-hydroxylase domain-containing protein n=1 Tax=Allofrancisella inopinata TaxID=1085647 RepID=A0AAE6YHB9_9GAMM|nr:aspartyl/asparaginyl beta-hydroxylase domain-containing protein [Allofrancisella inopinata]QIV95795.1 aspartyl/asparaginyl beta-hydroxylase domain-containing protein [Allofrancisella inopinata]TDT72809.1 beta-hydroxylase [Allofrancisella inopinata]
MMFFASLPMIIIYIIIISAIYIHYRGQARLTFFRQLTDHSTFFAPINVFMYIFSKISNKPYLNSHNFPELQVLEDNWRIIKNEALSLRQIGKIKASDKLDDAGFNSFFKTGWTRFYLKWYGKAHPSAVRTCPKTLELLKRVPKIKAAMFTYLPPGSKLVTHRDPFAGSLRYHLGLQTPNSHLCRMVVDGQQRHWRDGQSMMFDETYLHYAENQSDTGRLILLCDYERPMKFIIPKYVNNIISFILMRAAVAPNENSDKTGIVNRIFHYVYYVRILGKKLKARNKYVYQIYKYSLILLVIYLLLFSWYF